MTLADDMGQIIITIYRIRQISYKISHIYNIHVSESVGHHHCSAFRPVTSCRSYQLCTALTTSSGESKTLNSSKSFSEI